MSDPSVGLLLEVTREAVRDDALPALLATVLRDYRAALTDLVRADQERGSVPGRLRADGPRVGQERPPRTPVTPFASQAL